MARLNSDESRVQVRAEMRHFARLLRSRDVLPTPETMADRLDEWAAELTDVPLPRPPVGVAMKKTCPDCGSRVYSLGCVYCNEEAYIDEQVRLTERYGDDDDDPRTVEEIIGVEFPHEQGKSEISS